MFKLRYKKHVKESRDSGKVVIYYNIGDIFLGIVLFILVFFYIHDYLSHALDTSVPNYNGSTYTRPFSINQPVIKLPLKKNK